MSERPELDQRVRFTLSTYNGDYIYAQEGDTPRYRELEYGPPNAPVMVTRRAGDDVSAIFVDMDPDAKDHPGVQIERQTDRWSVLVQADSDGDGEVVVDVRDDGRVFVYPNGDPLLIDNLTVCGGDDQREYLPEAQCRFGPPGASREGGTPQQAALVAMLGLLKQAADAAGPGLRHRLLGLVLDSVAAVADDLASDVAAGGPDEVNRICDQAKEALGETQ